MGVGKVGGSDLEKQERMHEDSLAKCIRDGETAIRKAYIEGYAAGKEDGWDVGYNAGYADGYDDGFFERQADKRHDTEDER